MKKAIVPLLATALTMSAASSCTKNEENIKANTYVLVHGAGQALADLAMTDPGSRLGPSLAQSADKLTLDVNRDSLTYLFIKDGTQADKDRVVANYRAEPAIPFGNAVTLTNENFGTVEKVYIKTLQDIVISPAFQDKMLSSAGIKTVYTVNTSHSPFLAQPHEVSNLLLTIGQ